MRAARIEVIKVSAIQPRHICQPSKPTAKRAAPTHAKNPTVAQKT